MSLSSTPVVGLVAALLLLLFLAIRTRVHVLIAMLLAATIVGLSGGLNMSKTLNAITQGFGSTLGNIGLVIGLGVMMGRVLESSGAAEQIAYSFVKWVGKRRESWGLALTGYIVSIPVFVDSAFIILFPIAKTIAKNSRQSLLTLGIALASGLVITHHLVPPTPGPLAVAGLFGVNIGEMILVGLVLAVPCIIVMVLYAKWLATRYTAFSAVEDDETIKMADEMPAAGESAKKLPSLTRSLLPIIVPILLILLKSTITMVPNIAKSLPDGFGPLLQLIEYLGAPIISLAVSTLLAIYTLVPRLGREKTMELLEGGLQSAGIILLVTGTGGALGAVLRESGTANLLAEQIANWPLPPVMIPFIVATLVRLVQGSGTVAMITAASISAPILANIPGVNLLIAAQAAATGALCCSSFHDSLFWLVNRMMNVKTPQQQMMAWSVPTTLGWLTGLVGILVLNALF